MGPIPHMEEEIEENFGTKYGTIFYIKISTVFLKTVLGVTTVD